MGDEAEEQLIWECIQGSAEEMALLFGWRNDPEVRQASFHTEEKSFTTFAAQFEQRHGHLPALPPLFVRKDGERIAALLFEEVDSLHAAGRSCSLSIIVAPGHRSQGIGSKILQQIQPWVERRGYSQLLAEVRLENVASQRAFERAGFVLVHQGEKSIAHQQVAYYLYEALLRPFPSWGDKVYLVAEAGSNWHVGSYQNDLAMAKSLIEVAAESGADAVKFQTFRAETTYAPQAGSASYLEAKVGSKPMEELFKELSMPCEMIPEIAAYCQQCSIAFMSTPFSVEDLALVDPFVSLHKIASYEIGHLRLLEAVAQCGKPLFLSTGAATPDEIAWAVDLLQSLGRHSIILLQCTASYPAPPEEMHLRAMGYLAERFGLPVGLSDHSQDPLTAPLMAVAMGAVVIEKHFTLSHRLPGPDHGFALEPRQLASLVQAVRQAEAMRGSRIKAVTNCEMPLRQFARRGIQALRPIARGELLQEGKNVAILRPGTHQLGAHPRHLPAMDGKRFTQAVEIGEAIFWEQLEGGGEREEALP